MIQLTTQAFLSHKGNDYFPTELTAADGTIVRLCPLDLTKGKPIYCSRKGDFYSYRDNCLHWLKPNIVLHYNRKTCHARYPKISSYYGSKSLHLLMALTWLGARPVGMEIDHLNGDIFDWSLDNLQYVTPQENRKRARLLNVLRSIGRDPKKMSREELLEIFNKYYFVNPQKLD